MSPTPAATVHGWPAPGATGDDDAVCTEILAALRTATATPDAASDGLRDSALDYLMAMPPATNGPARIECLLEIVQLHHLRSHAAAALPIAQTAVELARAGADAPLLRKALTYLGVMATETGNPLAAVTHHCEALAIARTLDDTAAQAPVWSNLGLALRGLGHYEDAITCFERAADVAAGSAQFLHTHRAALANIADCALRLGRPERGLAAAHQAIALNPAPTTAVDCTSRTIAEANCARLLLAAGDAEQAAAHAEMARTHAARFPSPRSQVTVMMAQGAVQVQAGQCDIGLTNLQRALDLARLHLKSEVHDAVAACVAGYEAAGQPDVALVYLHDLLAWNRVAKADSILLHHRCHLEGLERVRARANGLDGVLASQHDRLRERLGERALLQNRILLLEQQAVAAELHDDTTGEHCYRVGRLASLLAHEIGLEEEVCFLIDLAARLHDIGKLVVPDAILQKPGQLTRAELTIMRTHAEAGADILGHTDLPQMHVAQEIARHHHERWDGTGYPMHLAGTTIPISARITALADVFDGVTHGRPYKSAWSLDQALSQIRRLSGAQFDPDLTDTFVTLVRRLQRETGDLDALLGAAARRSAIVQARRQLIHELRGSEGPSAAATPH